MQGAFPVKCKEQYISGFRTGQFSSHLMRIAYVVSTGAEGDFDWLINGKLHRVHAGDLVLFNFADLRMPLLKTRGEQVKIQVLTFPPDSTMNGASLTELYCSFSQNPVIPANQVGSLLPHFQRIWQEYQLQAPLSRESAAAALRLLLIDLIRIGREAAPQAAPLRNRTALAQAKLLSEVTAYLRQNLSDNLSLPQVATHFGVSQSSLQAVSAGAERKLPGIYTAAAGGAGHQHPLRWKDRCTGRCSGSRLWQHFRLLQSLLRHYRCNPR